MTDNQTQCEKCCVRDGDNKMYYECCCAEDAITVMKDNERARREGYVEVNGRWIKKHRLVFSCSICNDICPVSDLKIESTTMFCSSCHRLSIPVTKSNNDILIEKLNNAGIDKLVKILGEQFKRRITNIKSSSIALDKRRNLIISKILENVIKSSDENIAEKIINLYLTDEPKTIQDTEWCNDFKVGEEVLVWQGKRCRELIKGVIQKINKDSVTLNLYNYITILDDYAIQNQTYGYTRYVWTSLSREKTIIRTRDRLYKKNESCWDEYFVEGKRSVDYGW